MEGGGECGGWKQSFQLHEVEGTVCGVRPGVLSGQDPRAASTTVHLLSAQGPRALVMSGSRWTVSHVQFKRCRSVPCLGDIMTGAPSPFKHAPSTSDPEQPGRGTAEGDLRAGGPQRKD